MAQVTTSTRLQEPSRPNAACTNSSFHYIVCCGGVTFEILWLCPHVVPCCGCAPFPDVEFGRIQARDLLQHLWTGPISNAPVEIIQGGKSVEVRGVG